MRIDLKKHFIAGLVISVLTAYVLFLQTPVYPIFCCGLGWAAAAAVGWAKEYLYDAKRPEKHTVDKADAQYTAWGGAAGAVLALVLFMLVGD